MPFKNVHIIINPISGRNPPPYPEFADFMQEIGCEATLYITTLQFGADYYAEKATNAGADLVITYGGDGTVMTVANTLHNTDIPLGVVPGGTANIIAHELNVPINPKQALQFIAEEDFVMQWLDAGKVGDKHFLLRMGIGWEAELSQRPEREAKALWGTLAYAQAALEALGDLNPVTYHLTLDDEQVDVEGINCSICNIGNVGLYNVGISMDIKPDDSYLDVLILQNKDLQGALDIAQNVLASSLPLELEEQLVRYRAKRITVEPSQAQRVSTDGEAVDPTFPITVECVPQYARFLKPKQSNEGV